MLNGIAWLLLAGISWLCNKYFGWNLGQVFFILYLGIELILMLLIFASAGSAGCTAKGIDLLKPFIGVSAVYLIFEICFVLFFSWLSTLIFKAVDLYTAFALITLGIMLASSKTKEEK